MKEWRQFTLQLWLADVIVWMLYYIAITYIEETSRRMVSIILYKLLFIMLGKLGLRFVRCGIKHSKYCKHTFSIFNNTPNYQCNCRGCKLQWTCDVLIG